MYRALYRKYRPQRFEDVVGQQAITTALQNQILADKVGHAYLFTGTRGTGKTSCAKIFAKAVNCENRTGAEPCGACGCCRGLEDGSVLDVIEIDAASNNGVDDIRDLRDETAYRPSRCRYKVYIIDEVHMLSTAAFNALLKIMEEPPSHVIFILATTEIHKVPATILSRCQRYDFGRIDPQDMAARLLQIAAAEGLVLTSGAADLIARLADGALRDAVSLLDTCAGAGTEVDEALVRTMAGVADREYLFAISDAVADADVAALIGNIAQLREKSIDVKRLAEELVHHYRNFLLAAAKPGGALLETLPQQEKERYIAAAGRVSEADAIAAVRRLAAALDRMGRASDPRIELELALFDLAVPTGEAAPAQSAVPRPAPKVSPVASTPRVGAGPVAMAVTPAISSVPPVATAPILPTTPAVATQPVEVAPVAVVEPQPQDEVPPEPAAVPQAVEPAQNDDAPPWEEPADAEPEAAPRMEEVRQEPEAAQAVEASPPAEEPEMPAANGMAAEQGAPVEPPAAQTAGPPPDGVQPFGPWADVVAAMKEVDRMLFTHMKKATAYTDGRRVLIDGGEMFKTYIKEYKEAAEKLKAVIQQVTGKRYGLGPYTPGEQAAQPQAQVTAQDTLQAWQQQGIPVKYE